MRRPRAAAAVPLGLLLSLAVTAAGAADGAAPAAGGGEVMAAPWRLDFAAAIAFGQSFRSHLEFVQAGLRNNRVQLSSRLPVDGISKTVTFFTDYDAVAAAAARARQELRSFTVPDAQKLPLEGVLHAALSVRARGRGAVEKMDRLFVKNRPHLVLETASGVVQPLWNEVVRKGREDSVGLPVAFLAGQEPHGPASYAWSESTLEMDFVFSTPREPAGRVLVVLLDGEGRRVQKPVDLQRVLRLPPLSEAKR